MMSMIWTVFWFLLVISILIFVHEFGHFIMAKRSGIKVIEFALGLGPKLIKVQKGETLYSVRLLPFGGFCRFLNEHVDLAQDLETGKITQEEYERLLPRTFERKSYARRMGVLMGGSVFNILLGAVLFMLLFAVWGVQVGVSTNALSDITPNYPASQAGLLPGDRIVSINGLPTPDGDAVTSAILAASTSQTQPQPDPQTQPTPQTEPQAPQPHHQTEPQQDFPPLTLTVQAPDGNLRDVIVTPIYHTDKKKPVIGITTSVDYTFQKLSPIEALKRGMILTGGLTKDIVSFLFGLVTTGQGADQVTGVVGIAKIVGQFATHGVYTLGMLMAALSIQLGILNLLPFPALDGGQIVILSYERIRGKELSLEVKGFVQLVGFALLMTLMVVLIFKDVFFPIELP